MLGRPDAGLVTEGAVRYIRLFELQAQILQDRWALFSKFSFSKKPIVHISIFGWEP